jgi:hypothetical protein
VRGALDHLCSHATLCVRAVEAYAKEMEAAIQACKPWARPLMIILICHGAPVQAFPQAKRSQAQASFAMRSGSDPLNGGYLVDVAKLRDLFFTPKVAGDTVDTVFFPNCCESWPGRAEALAHGACPPAGIISYKYEVANDDAIFLSQVALRYLADGKTGAQLVAAVAADAAVRARDFQGSDSFWATLEGRDLFARNKYKRVIPCAEMLQTWARP